MRPGACITATSQAHRASASPLNVESSYQGQPYSQIMQAQPGVIKPTLRCNQVATVSAQSYEDRVIAEHNPLFSYLEHGMIHCLCMESYIRFSGDSYVDAPRLPLSISRQSACAREALGVGKGARWPLTLECHRVWT